MSSRRKFLGQMLTGSSAAFVFLQSNALATVTDAASKINPGTTPKQLAFDEGFWGRIQTAFDVDRTIINFNNGGVSPSPRVVQDALKQYIDYSNQLPSYKMWRHLEPKRERVRQMIADSFGCNKEEIALTRNASESLETVQLGLHLKEGDEVLTTTQDYPRMLTTWDQRMRRDGIKINKISYPVPLMNKNDFLNRLEDAITPKTKVILLSHVIFLTGQILPILEASRIAHDYNIQLICDGAHSFFHFPFTLKDLECDYFGTSLHKWTYAPIGTGFLYMKKELIPDIYPLMAASEEMDNDIRKFEERGTHPAANHNAISEAIIFNEGIGIDRKAERFRYLHKRWINKLSKYDNVNFMTNINDESNWCGIVNVNVEGTEPGKVSSYLMKEHNIFVVPIKHDEFQGLRISPNVYTLTSEIDYFAEVMEDIAKGNVKDLKKDDK